MLAAFTGSRLLNRMSMSSDDDDIKNFREFPAIPTKYTLYNIYGGALAQGVHGFPILNGGLFPRLCNIIGESGTGKTSWAIGACTSAVDYIQTRFGTGYSELYYYDPENNTPVKRFLDVSGWDKVDYMSKCSYSNSPISILDLANVIIKISETKQRYKKDFLLPSGIMDVDGKEVTFLAPTFICVDSIAAVNPNGVEDLVQNDRSGEIKDLQTLSGGMEAAKDAAAWTVFVRKIKPFLDKGNIGLYCINHKTKDIKLDLYSPETRYLPFLLPGEKLKGGKEFIYQSFNIVNFSSGEKFTAKNPVYGEKMTGWASRVSFVKNKFNVEGMQFPMVFDQNNGYSALLSDMEYLFQTKFGFQGVSSLQLDVLPEIRFTRKTLNDVVYEHPQLARAIQFTAKYRACCEMLYGCAPVSLQGFSNLPLPHRLSVIYGLTQRGDANIEKDSYEMNSLAKIAMANRHYWTILKPDTYTSNVLIDSTNIDNASGKYQTMFSKGVSPFDVELGKAKIVGNKYIELKQ